VVPERLGIGARVADLELVDQAGIGDVGDVEERDLEAFRGGSAPLVFGRLLPDAQDIIRVDWVEVI